MWGKLIKESRILSDAVVAFEDADTRTHHTFRALTELCHILDLPEPIWLEKNIEEFRRFGKTRFTPDSFVESISFDYLSIEIIEE